MSILIKGMAMPKNCGECPLRSEVIMPLRCKGVYGEPPIYTTEELPNEKALMSKRHSMCPLIEVPPHGDLIDRDKLLERFAKEQKAADEHGRDFSFSFYSGNEVCAEWWAVENFVVDAPVVVESEGT